MNVLEAIYAHLVANPRVAAVLSNRIYPDKLPQDVTKPAAVYFVISSPRTYSYDAPSGVADTRLQFNVHGLRKEDAKGGSEAIRQAVSGFAGMLGGPAGVDVTSIFVDDEDSGYDDELELYTSRIDIIIEHAES